MFLGAGALCQLVEHLPGMCAQFIPSTIYTKCGVTCLLSQSSEGRGVGAGAGARGQSGLHENPCQKTLVLLESKVLRIART